MNTPACQDIQRRLLETEAGGLTSSESDHLRDCPACRAVAQDVQTAGKLLFTLARQAGRQLPMAPPPALKARVLAQVRAQDAQNGSAAESLPNGFKPRASIIVPVNAASDNPQRSWAWLDALSEILVRWRWAAAACLLLMVSAAATVKVWQGRSIGKLEFASGPTSLRTPTLAQQHVGVGQWACQRGSTLSTPENAAAHFSVGEGVQALMARATTLQVLEKEKIALARGSVWLNVTPGGKGFKVQTPFALVQVTGTRFGVTVTARETRVDVAEGSVVVSQAQSQGTVTAGLALTAGPQGVTATVPRLEGANPPAWVDSLLAAEKIARARSYLPSIGKRP